jgi:hypothetical protein
MKVELKGLKTCCINKDKNPGSICPVHACDNSSLVQLEVHARQAQSRPITACWAALTPSCRQQQMPLLVHRT